MGKYLVLGGNGFIGKCLCNYLYDKGEQVCSFDLNFPDMSKVGIEYQCGDFFEDEKLQKIIMQADVIYHAISTINPGNSNEKYMNGYDGDLIQTIKLCTWIKDTDKKLIFLSSGGTVYGDQNVQPIAEDALPLPINHYGNVKLCMENALRIFHIQNRMNVRIARISNPYGPGQDYMKGVGFIDAVMKRSLRGVPVEIWGDGENVRDYIYIEDVCKLLYTLSKYEGEEILFNLSSGEGYSQNEVIDILKKMGMTVHVNYKDSRIVDLRKSVLDNTKIMDISNEKLIGIKTGIEKYYKYLRNLGIN